MATEMMNTTETSVPVNQFDAYDAQGWQTVGMGRLYTVYVGEGAPEDGYTIGSVIFKNDVVDAKNAMLNPRGVFFAESPEAQLRWLAHYTGTAGKPESKMRAESVASHEYHIAAMAEYPRLLAERDEVRRITTQAAILKAQARVDALADRMKAREIQARKRTARAEKQAAKDLAKKTA